jgi:hypothetical protein
VDRSEGGTQRLEQREAGSGLVGAGRLSVVGRGDQVDHDCHPRHAEVVPQLAGAVGDQLRLDDLGVEVRYVADQILQCSFAQQPGAQQDGLLQQDLGLALDDEPEAAHLGRRARDADGAQRGFAEDDRQRDPRAHPAQAARLRRVVGGRLHGAYDLHRRLVEGAHPAPVPAADHGAAPVGDEHVEPDDVAGVTGNLLCEGRRERRRQGRNLHAASLRRAVMSVKAYKSPGSLGH